MIGTFVNVAAVVVGSVVGMIIRSRLHERYMNIAFQGIGLVTLAIGISMSMELRNILLAIVSIVAGAIVGESLRIENRMDNFAQKIKRKINSSSDRFVEGFVTASILYCVGSMAVLGSFEDGIGQYPKLLYTKSLMDCIASVALASTFGIGVLFSIFPLFIYQGALTLLASYVVRFMNETVIADINGVGGILLLGLGLHVLKITKISVMNMLPSLVFIAVLSYLFG